MKKSLFIGLFAVLGLIGCSRNQEIDVPDANLSIFARTESPADTKTIVESGVHVYWEPGDKIAVFMGEKSAKFTTDITAASETASFMGTFGEETWPDELDLWAVYPFSEEATFDGETITTTLSSEQIAREGSFGKDMNLSIAHSTSTSLQFYNVGGGIRFSVSEEGIKKVMFEGLSGEIISGKVKIGLDENGKPVVKEVTEGSQFITLLPPSGKETFEKNTWYYIIAIPGTLDGGYKLRFYKDTNYARKVSEKKVEIKRSIYGNIEKADEGIEYEATTTHFPETKEEWDRSTVISKRIASEVDLIVSEIKEASGNTFIGEELIPHLLKVEGIVDAYALDSGEGVVLIQSDGVYINLLLNVGLDEEDEEDSNSEDLSFLQREIMPYNVTPDNDEKKALVITPYQNSGISKSGLPKCTIGLKSVYEDLNALGYKFHWLNDDDETSTLPYFSPDYLSSNYDLIVIATHGGFDTSFKDLEGNTLGATMLMTSSEVGSIDFSTEDYKALGAFLSHDKIRYGITKNWLEGVESSTGTRAHFNNAIVFAMACNSYKQDDLADYFIQRHASAYCGNTENIKLILSSDSVKTFVKLLTMGASVRNSINITKDKVYDVMFFSAIHPPLRASDENNGPVFLIDPTPFDLHNSEIRDSKTTLIWDQVKTNGDYQFKVYIKWPGSNSFSIYDSTTSRAYTTDALQPGDYSWYVEANLYYDGKVIETFLSDTKYFTVTEDNQEETLLSRTHNGKTYSIIRKNVSSTDYRINGDGSKFYTCSYSVKVDNDTYDLPGSFYSYTDRDFRDSGPVMAINAQTGEIHVFFIEKDTDETYGMCGYMFNIANGSISQQTVFTYSNFGWFPFFTWEEDQLALNCFSYSGYFAIIAFQNDNWTLYSAGDIYPDDFKAKQRGKELIYIY